MTSKQIRSLQNFFVVQCDTNGTVPDCRHKSFGGKPCAWMEGGACQHRENPLENELIKIDAIVKTT